MPGLNDVVTGAFWAWSLKKSKDGFFKKDVKGEKKEENEDICKNWCVCMVKQEANVLGAWILSGGR